MQDDAITGPEMDGISRFRRKNLKPEGSTGRFRILPRCILLQSILSSSARTTPSTPDMPPNDAEPRCRLFAITQFECSPSNGRVTCWPLERLFRQ